MADRKSIDFEFAQRLLRKSCHRKYDCDIDCLDGLEALENMTENAELKNCPIWQKLKECDCDSEI